MKDARIKTNDGWLEFDSLKAIRDYHRLMSLPEGSVGMDEIGVDSCVDNGWDTAKESGVPKEDMELAAMYWAVETAKGYELPGF
jgi:hypothetical protein